MRAHRSLGVAVAPPERTSGSLWGSGGPDIADGASRTSPRGLAGGVGHPAGFDRRGEVCGERNGDGEEAAVGVRHGERGAVQRQSVKVVALAEEAVVLAL